MASTAEVALAREPGRDRERESLLLQAGALGIPWERILLEEIQAERTLREYLAETELDCPLGSILWVLPRSLLHSFRARDLIGRLSWDAETDGSRGAVRELRRLFKHLSGAHNGRNGGAALMAKHLWFGYQRVLKLQGIRRAARKTRGDVTGRIERVAEMTGCASDDAQWAVRREVSPKTSHALDDAMRKAREEGFELPAAESETRAFRRLQRFVKSSPHLNGTRRD